MISFGNAHPIRWSPAPHQGGETHQRGHVVASERRADGAGGQRAQLVVVEEAVLVHVDRLLEEALPLAHSKHDDTD